jgi:hypothetical protein
VDQVVDDVSHYLHYHHCITHQQTEFKIELLAHARLLCTSDAQLHCQQGSWQVLSTRCIGSKYQRTINFDSETEDLDALVEQAKAQHPSQHMALVLSCRHSQEASPGLERLTPDKVAAISMMELLGVIIDV